MQRLHERYRVIERIGDGGAGAVFRVEDEASGDIVAMKVLPRSSGRGLRGEFLSLARLRHDNIVSVFDYGLTDTGQDFFTMEYVVGPALLQAGQPPSSPAFYQLVGGVLRALAFVHARGMVHADIKPSNILVDGDLLDERPVAAARLADFGLAAHLDDPASRAGRGTLSYAAPEVYAGRLDARSDLYSLGVVLYELVTGAPPFVHRDVRQLVEAQRTSTPRDPRQLRPDLPAGLAELLLGLLDPAPGARPQTADEVLARINDIAGTDFAIADSRPLVDVGGVLVGRARELAALDRLWQEARGGRGGAAVVRGEPGVGRSRLLAAHKLAVQLDDGRVLAASARDPALGGLALRGQIASGEGGREGEVEARYARAEAAVDAMFDLAGDAPLLVLVDDVERADPGTADILAYLARAAEAGPILVCLADATGAPARSVALGAAMDELAPERRIELEPLDRGAITELVEHGFSRDVAAALTAPLYRASGGNPSLAARALAELVESGALARERGAWVLRDEVVDIEPPRDADAAASARLERLPHASRAALRAVSMVGAPFDRELGAALCAELPGAPADPAALEAALAEAVAARLIDADPAAGRYEVVSATAARLLSDELDDAARRRLHRRAAAIYEARAAAGVPVPSAELARHLLALGDGAAAVRWGRRAAEERAAAQDFRAALDWMRRIEPHCPRDEASPIHERIGDLSAVLGEIDAALAAYERAHELASQPTDRVRLAGRAADLLRRSGQGDRAHELLMTALELARQRGLHPAEIQTHLHIGQVLWYRGDFKAALEHAVAGQLLARQRGDRRGLADLVRLEAQVAVSRGDSRAALALYEGALHEARALGEPLLEAQVLLQVGRAAVHAAEYGRAIEALTESIPLNKAAGRVEKVAAALNNLGGAHYMRGDWREARDAWERFRRLCERLGEKTELVFALNNLGSLYRDLGELSEAMALLDRAAGLAAGAGQAQTAASILANRGEVLMRTGELGAAAECYARARGQFDALGARDDVIETARRQCELALAAGRVRESLDGIVEVARMARDAGLRLEEGIAHRVAAAGLRLTGDLDTAQWFCDRAGEILATVDARYQLALLAQERAELTAAHGDQAAAKAQLEAAAAELGELGARWDLSRLRARLRDFEPRPRSSTGRLQVSAADQSGLAVLVDLARASSHMPVDRVLEQALDSLLGLTGFERGFLLLLDEDGKPRERTRRSRPGARGFARDESEFSGSIVRRVASTGEPVAIDDMSGEIDLRHQKSVVALGLRRVMCAPMRARGRLLGVAYVDSQSDLARAPISLSVFEAITSHLALLIDNARLLADDAQKGELMAVLAHEIRNPLAAILGFADIGREEGVGGEDGVDLFTRIRRDGERLQRLLNNIMELVRHDTGKLDWSSAAIDMTQLLTTALDSFTPVCRDKEIVLTSELEGLERRALGNEDRLMQVVSNLLGNAYKFSARRGRIHVRARIELVSDADPDSPLAPASDLRAWSPFGAASDTREMVRVDITDTGPGMTEEECRSLFEKFAQGTAGHRRMGGGVGLGLYISREIILRHGGSIWASASPGEGATFSFRIPVEPV